MPETDSATLRLTVRLRPGAGAPRSFRPPVAPERELSAPDPGPLVTGGTRELLNFFEKCPHCGSFAQASEVTRVFASGTTERILFLTCGLPCGWIATPRTLGRESPA